MNAGRKKLIGIFDDYYMEEFEIKFLEVNVPELEEKLKAIGAEKVGEYDFHRAIFDYPDLRLFQNNAWIRLRTNGKETTLTFKQTIKDKKSTFLRDLGAKEIEVEVSDFKKTFILLQNIGLIVKREEKNRRIRYQKSAVVYDIDFWPQIPPYLEIEADSLAETKRAAAELGLDGEKGLICSSGDIYIHYGINVHDYKIVTFDKMAKK